jgi:hypothetical protein
MGRELNLAERVDAVETIDAGRNEAPSDKRWLSGLDFSRLSSRKRRRLDGNAGATQGRSGGSGTQGG